MTIRVRGIYATALTELFSSGGRSGAEEGTNDTPGVVQASKAIDDRFEGREFPIAPARATVETTDDRQGVAVVGASERVATATDVLADVGVDAFAWRDRTPKGAIFAGEVRETLGSGAVVALGDPEGTIQESDNSPLESLPLAASEGTGFLPYGNSDDRIDDGDVVRVQVDEPVPPWSDDRPVLDTRIRVDRSLLTIQRSGVTDTGGPHIGDVLPIDPPEDWGVRWAPTSEDASLDALGDALERAADRAADIDDALAASGDVDDLPGQIAAGTETVWCWFGRECRFALDGVRRSVTPTMPGHHRTKAGANEASTAVDFVESICPGFGGQGETKMGGDGDAGDEHFPFDAVTRQFGPAEGDRIAIQHGKPDGRLLTLGRADVASVEDDGTVTLRRELTSSGTYDGLGTPRERGDVATTKIVEGRWWYPTIYRSADGQHRGTYVNVCTPVEVFPRSVRYVDLHVDVVECPDGEVERLDDEELDAAEASGFVDEPLATKARAVASAVERGLR